MKDFNTFMIHSGRSITFGFEVFYVYGAAQTVHKESGFRTEAAASAAAMKWLANDPEMMIEQAAAANDGPLG